jgi:predicted flap endonuclease-1-like 5' DNA nuclease
MAELIQANWLAFALVLVIGLLVAWWLYGRATTAGSGRSHAPDALDKGAVPAARNQALIDAPSAAASITPAPMSVGMAGIGEIIAVAAQDEVEAAAEAAPATVPAAGAADDLALIKGVGPKLVALLTSMGVTRFAQIAAWTDADIASVDAKLGTFAGRITRDNWVEQCKFLAEGDKAGFEGKFGKI